MFLDLDKPTGDACSLSVSDDATDYGDSGSDFSASFFNPACCCRTASHGSLSLMFLL